MLLEEPDPKRQSERMEKVNAAKEAELLAALWVEDPIGTEATEVCSRGGAHAGKKRKLTGSLVPGPGSRSRVPGTGRS